MKEKYDDVDDKNGILKKDAHLVKGGHDSSHNNDECNRCRRRCICGLDGIFIGCKDDMNGI